MGEQLKDCTHKHARELVEKSDHEYFHSVFLIANPGLVLPVGFSDFTKEALLLLLDYLKTLPNENDAMALGTGEEENSLTIRFGHGFGAMVLLNCTNCHGKLAKRPLHANKFMNLIRGEQMERILSED